MITSRQAKYLVWGLFLFTTLVVLYRELVYFPDSEGYLKSYLIRTAGYPLFLRAVTAISGEYFEWILKGLQAVIGCWGIGYFLRKLKRLKILQPLSVVVLCVVLLAPYVFDIRIGNKVLSEALAYPLFLVVIAQLFGALIRRSNRSLLLAIPWLLLLLSVRNQFIFLVPIGIALAYLIYRDKGQLRPFLMVMILWLAIPLVGNLTDRSYHYLQHGHFVRTPWQGIHFMAPAMFVAELEDVDLFDEEVKRNYFSQMHASLAAKKLHIDHPNDFYWDPVVIYVYQFTEIANSTLFMEGREIIAPGKDRYETFIEVDRVTGQMAPVLIKNNFRRWFRIYRGNFVHGIGSTALAVVLLFLLLYGIYSLSKRNASRNMECMTLALLLLYGNMALVSLGMYTVNRFTFYNHWAIFFLLILWIQAGQASLKAKK
ncbi:hypothetical protein [Aureitalea marina]|uniref:Glycosyltransferase RgtA/B/C/D-like domain-containing protein n=1 Tax=Aureitalea marina TaxID=930804 RepID=A0A2S7KQG3_9FLAO|nr:hypothetical protein [Aureitalea marina]PQB04850.1 hypothetical protein BST85_08050 [Aureitalea marina]